jgi:hypothetical protein
MIAKSSNSFVIFAYFQRLPLCWVFRQSHYLTLLCSLHFCRWYIVFGCIRWIKCDAACVWFAHSSVVRPFRLAATVAAAQLVTSWIHVMKTLMDARDTAQRQLMAEEKKSKVGAALLPNPHSSFGWAHLIYF